MSWLIAHPQFVIAPLAAAAWLGFRAWQASGFKLPTMPAIGGGDNADDAADFAALARLRKRFDKAKCSEGLAACDTCLTHFFHGGEA